MPFDLSNLNPTTRFYWPDSDDEWVEFQLLTDRDRRDILKSVEIKQKVEYKVNPATGRMERIEYFDADLDKNIEFARQTYDRQIKNWHLVTPSGENIPCTRENKLLMVEHNEQFKVWVDKCLTEMRKDEAEIEQVEQKN